MNWTLGIVATPTGTTDKIRLNLVDFGQFCTHEKAVCKANSKHLSEKL